MNWILNRTLLSSLMATGLIGATFLPYQSALADKKVGRDAAVGAGVGAVSGAIRGRGSVINNAVKCGAAGAAVNGANGLRKNPRNRSLAQDVAVGAASGVAVGAITRPGKDTLGDAVDCGAAGAVINIINRRKK